MRIICRISTNFSGTFLLFKESLALNAKDGNKNDAQTEQPKGAINKDI